MWAIWLVLASATAAPSTPPTLDSLHHRFYALRHGQSVANVHGIISSDPDVACVEHGLSAEGLGQARRAAKAVCIEALSRGVDGVAIVSSDFLRASQTAQAVRAAVLDAGITCWPSEDVLADTALRERSFGELNGKSDLRYDDVWKHDVVSASHTEFGSEPILSVQERAWGVVERLEANEELRPGRWMVVIVAHGDVLQILQTAFARVDVRTHRSQEHLETATLRALQLSSTSG